MNYLFKVLFLTFLSLQALISSQIQLTPKEKEFLKSHRVITLGSDYNWIPYIIKNEDGLISGYDADILKEVNRLTGANFKLVIGKWKDIVEDAKDRKIDGLSTSAIHDERQKYFNFSDIYVSSQRLLIVSNLNPKNIHSVDDLKDKKIGYQKNNLFEKKLVQRYKDSTAIAYENYSLMLDDVVEGKIDAIIGSYPLIYFAQKEGFPFIEIINRIPNSGLNLVFSLRKDYPEALSILNKGLKNISYEDKMKIHSKWFFGETDIDLQKNSSLFNKGLVLSQKEKSYLNQKEVIKLCVLPSWLPFEQIDENTNHKGIGADIIKIISKKLDVKFELVPTKQWSTSLENIRNRKCDILPVAMDIPSRRDAMNFTKPYVKEPFVIATTEDKFYIRDINDLSNKKIGIVKSYAILEVIKKQNPLIEIVEVKNTTEGLKKVSSGEIYGYIDIMPTVGYFIQKHGLYNLKIAGKLSSSIDLSVASRNDEPILNIIMQKALNTISKEEMRTIVGRWIEIKVQQEFDYQKLFYVIFFFLVIVFMVLYKNRSIKKMNQELKMINEKLHEANHEVIEQQNMVDKHVMILTTDLDGKIKDANSAYCEKTGFPKEEILGCNHFCMGHPDMPVKVFNELWEDIKANKTWRGEVKNITNSNETIYLQMVIEPLMKKNEKIGYRSICEDITDKKRIEELSITDKLTNLYNRLKIDELLNEQANLYKRYETPFSIILLDVDNFKSINDMFGHDVGDYVLKKIARLLKINIRNTDFVGRWGGEEFLIICQNSRIDDAYILAEKIRKIIEKTVFDKVSSQTISLGVTEYTNSDDLLSVFKSVDKALYVAKNSGKNKTIKSKDIK